MPFGKPSQVPVPRPHMVKKHTGFGNHKQRFISHAAVAANAKGFKTAPAIQPNNGSGSPKSAMN